MRATPTKLDNSLSKDNTKGKMKVSPEIHGTMNKTGRQLNGRHPNSLKNLVPRMFKPGQSGNPKGRPKKEFSLTSLAKVMLLKDPELAKGIVTEWLSKSRENPVFLRELLERLEGKVTLPIGGDDLRPIQIEFVRRKEPIGEETMKGGRKP